MHKKIATAMVFMALMFFGAVTMAADVVNLNKANAAAIQQNLVGIGPIKAEAIISYRKKNGKFKSLDDLQNVTGIGPALVKKNKRYLSLSKGVVSGDDKAYAAAKKQAGKGKSGTTKKKSTKTTKTSKKSTAKTTKKTSKKKATSTTAKPAKKTTSKKTTSDKKPKKKKKKKKKKTSKSTT